MPKYTKKIIKKGGSGLTRSYKSMSNLPNSQKTTGKRKRSLSPQQKSKKTLTLDLNAAEEATEEINQEKKDKEERDKYMEDKNKSIAKKMQKQKEQGYYLPIEPINKNTIKINQTKSAAEEVDEQWDADRKYRDASMSGVTFSPLKSPKKNKNTTIFGFPNFSPIQGSPQASPLPVLSHSSINNRIQIPFDLFPLSPTKPGKGGKKHRKKTCKMKKTNRNKNRKSRRNSKKSSNKK